MTEATLRVLLLLGTGISVLAISIFIFRWSPKSMVTVWTLTLFFVPIWVGAQAGVFYSAITVVTIVVIASSSLRGFRFSTVDILLLSFTLLLILGWVLGWIQWGHLLIACLGWMVPYLGGRLISSRVDLSWIYRCLAVGVVAAAFLGIAEFLTGINLFTKIKMNNGLYVTWHDLQYRGGELRIEGAFGHSIAFGTSLALCSVFILVVGWPQWVKLVSLLTVAIAVSLTFSRIGLICLVLTLSVGLFALRRDVLPSLRWKVVGLATLAGVIGIPLLLDVFVEAGSEAAGSAAYRGSIFSLVGTASFLGLSKSWSMNADGTTYFGSFQSIDSELVLTAVRFGILPLALALCAFAFCVAWVLGNRAAPAAVAVIGFIPAFATVAMITQYASLAWFLVGLAVASYPRASHGSRREQHLLVGQPIAGIQDGEEASWLRQ